MSIVETISRNAGRIAGDVQLSLKRARLEGERRLLLRDHRAALETLGTRVMTLAQGGDVEIADIAAEMSAVNDRAAEVAAKQAEIDAIRADAGDATESRPRPEIESGGQAPAAGPGWDAAKRFFPGAK